MTSTKSSGRIWYLILAGIVALILVGGLMSFQPYGNILSWVIRGSALLGYLAVFLAIVSSAYMKQMVRIFGRPFIKVHHILSVTGLALVTLHPVGVALNSATLRVFLPKFDSLTIFLQLGGRPAWYLLLVAALAAVLRRTIGRNWRTVHFLNYVAFWLATAHAVMIGTDFQHVIMKVLAIVMSLVVVAVFIQKRLRANRR
ncbi:MAG: ferric reductase [Chloroflexota bacterium]|nr:ferric reductase [Chloroflexota bacterium]